MLGKYDSYGMMAGADEVDLGDDHTGIIELDSSVAEPGKPFADIFNLKDKDAKALLLDYMGHAGVTGHIADAHNLRECYIAQRAMEHNARTTRLISQGVRDSSKIMAETRNFLAELEGCYINRNTSSNIATDTPAMMTRCVTHGYFLKKFSCAITLH
jgi:hypothetical protein